MNALARDVQQALSSGQVIADAAAVVKELVENALDAGASSIEVRLDAGGSRIISVADNGTGVAAEDRAFLARPHYTSKISGMSDLTRIASYGFRGEALASIAALARQLRVTTCVAGDRSGEKLEIGRDGRVMRSNPVSRQAGTTIEVLDLFHSMPVRRNVMLANRRRDAGNVAAIVRAYGLIHPRVRFRLTNPPAQAVVKPGRQDIPSVIDSLFGMGIVSRLTKIDWEDQVAGAMLTITGMFPCPSRGKPDTAVARRTPDRIFLYVNQRWVQNPALVRVVTAVYRDQHGDAASAKHPTAVINLGVAPDRYDLNVTPDKRTVFLHNEDAIVAQLRQVLTTVAVFGGADAPDSDVVPDSQVIPSPPAPLAPRLSPPARVAPAATLPMASLNAKHRAIAEEKSQRRVGKKSKRLRPQTRELPSFFSSPTTTASDTRRDCRSTASATVSTAAASTEISASPEAAAAAAPVSLATHEREAKRPRFLDASPCLSVSSSPRRRHDAVTPVSSASLPSQLRRSTPCSGEQIPDIEVKSVSMDLVRSRFLASCSAGGSASNQAFASSATPETQSLVAQRLPACQIIGQLCEPDSACKAVLSAEQAAAVPGVSLVYCDRQLYLVNSWRAYECHVAARMTATFPMQPEPLTEPCVLPVTAGLLAVYDADVHKAEQRLLRDGLAVERRACGLCLVGVHASARAEDADEILSHVQADADASVRSASVLQHCRDAGIRATAALREPLHADLVRQALANGCPGECLHGHQVYKQIFPAARSLHEP